jgi:hypothetical protein
MPDITIKNEPLSPPLQSMLEHEYDCGLVPKVEPSSYTAPNNRDTDRGYSEGTLGPQTRVNRQSLGSPPSTTPHRTLCSTHPHQHNHSTAATQESTVGVPTTHQQQLQLPRHQARFVDAVQKGNLSELEHLLDVGELNVNGFDAEGQTALHRVCCDGNLDIVKLLVRFGADVRLCNKDGWAALHLACFGGNQNIVAFLLCALKTRTT